MRWQRAMLEYHFNAPNRTVTYTQLAKAAGKDDYQVANKQYCNLGMAIGKDIEFQWRLAEENRSIAAPSASMRPATPATSTGS
jgi:hypothetical protein